MTITILLLIEVIIFTCGDLLPVYNKYVQSYLINDCYNCGILSCSINEL